MAETETAAPQEGVSDDERYVRHIEQRLKAAGLEGVGVVRGVTHAAAQNSVAAAEEIERRLVQVHNEKGEPIVGVVKNGPLEEVVADVDGAPIVRQPRTVDRPLAHDELVDGQPHPGVIAVDQPVGDGTAVVDGQVVDVAAAREAQRKTSTLVADRRIAHDEVVEGQERAGVVAAPHPGPLPGPEIVQSDRNESAAEIDARLRAEEAARTGKKAAKKAEAPEPEQTEPPGE